MMNIIGKRMVFVATINEFEGVTDLKLGFRLQNSSTPPFYLFSRGNL
jgi:hypothetical protein